MVNRATALKVLSAPVKLVFADFRLQIPILLALIYYPDKLKELLPESVYPWIASAGFLRGLQVLLGLNVTRLFNKKLSQYVVNNWKPDAKFINSKEIVLITGGSSGIGELVALDFAKRGVMVVSLDVNPPKNAQPGVHFYKADVTSSENLAAVGAEIRKAHGEPTVLINNAAVGYAMTILDEPEASIRRSFEVNTFAHFLTVREFLPAMIKKNHGHIVTVASMASYVTVASIVDYNCTKAAAVAFHEGLASELKHRYDAPNVRTSLINPTWVRTPLIGPLIADPTFNDIVLEPEDVSSAIVKSILSGRSNHVILPSEYTPVAGIRAWPAWMQEGLRNKLGYLMDVRVRYGGKFKRDPRLDGGSMEDLKA